jgi:hypothetical protein
MTNVLNYFGCYKELLAIAWGDFLWPGIVRFVKCNNSELPNAASQNTRLSYPFILLYLVLWG